MIKPILDLSDMSIEELLAYVENNMVAITEFHRTKNEAAPIIGEQVDKILLGGGEEELANAYAFLSAENLQVLVSSDSCLYAVLRILEYAVGRGVKHYTYFWRMPKRTEEIHQLYQKTYLELLRLDVHHIPYDTKRISFLLDDCGVTIEFIIYVLFLSQFENRVMVGRRLTNMLHQMQERENAEVVKMYVDGWISKNEQ